MWFWFIISVLIYKMLSCQSSKLCDFKTWWKPKSATWRNIRTRPIIKNIEKVLVWFMWIWLKLRMKWSSRLLFPSTIVSALFFFRGPVAWKWSRSRAALIYAPFVWNRLLHYSRLLFPHLADIFTRNENSFFIPTISFKRFFFFSRLDSVKGFYVSERKMNFYSRSCRCARQFCFHLTIHLFALDGRVLGRG